MESINFLYELQGENKIKYYESLINGERGTRCDR